MANVFISPAQPTAKQALGSPLVEERRLSRGPRLCAIVAAALALAACNAVGSVKPLFAAVDAAGAPNLKPGVWSVEMPCAGVNGGTVICNDKPQVLVTAGELRMIAIDQVKGAPRPPAAPFDHPTAYVLAAGDPRILQGRVTFPADADTPAKTLFMFMALIPNATDARGRITGGEVWPIVCGPKDGAAAPLRGLTMNPDGSCVPADQAAVRRTAQPSRAWTNGPATIKWVRVAR
jgi:hypothetical protein